MININLISESNQLVLNLWKKKVLAKSSLAFIKAEFVRFKEDRLSLFIGLPLENWKSNKCPESNGIIWRSGKTHPSLCK